MILRSVASPRLVVVPCTGTRLTPGPLSTALRSRPSRPACSPLPSSSSSYSTSSFSSSSSPSLSLRLSFFSRPALIAPLTLRQTACRRRHYSSGEAASSSSSSQNPQDQAGTAEGGPNPIISINTFDEYQRLVKEASKTKPIIVDCFADWCKPCKDLAPLIETVIRSREGKVTLAKVDIDKVSEVAVQLSVSSIPAVFAMYKKEIVSKFVGLKSKSELEDFVDAAIKKAQS